MAYQSINPYNGKILTKFDEINDQQLDTAIETATACFETWRRSTFSHRAAIVAKAASIMRTRVDEFARPVTLEMGKLINQARGEVHSAPKFSITTPAMPSASWRPNT